jgi:hypothetical protein
MPAQKEFDIPEWNVVVQEQDDGTFIMGLMISTQATMHTFYLADKTTYKRVAGQMREQIMRAGSDIEGRSSGLIIAKGAIPDGLRKT